MMLLMLNVASAPSPAKIEWTISNTMKFTWDESAPNDIGVSGTITLPDGLAVLLINNVLLKPSYLTAG